MQAPILISYAVFLANVQESDLRALSLFAGGDIIKTMDPVESEFFNEIGLRLFNAGCLTRFRRSREVLSNDIWDVYDARVAPGALLYVAQCAMERVTLSRDVEIPTPPVQP